MKIHQQYSSNNVVFFSSISHSLIGKGPTVEILAIENHSALLLRGPRDEIHGLYSSVVGILNTKV